MDFVKARERTIISTAFPNVALSKAPTTSPASAASSSVALLNSIASGRIASIFMENTKVGFQPLWPPRMPIGTKNRRRRMGDEERKGLRPHHCLRTFTACFSICVFVRRGGLKS
jgi:hypothetical protein